MIATKPMYSFVVIKFSSFISTEQSAFQKSIKVMYERAKVAKTFLYQSNFIYQNCHNYIWDYNSNAIIKQSCTTTEL